MKSLYLAWQAPVQSPMSRAWFPVGRLDGELNTKQEVSSCRFRYIGGAERAQNEAGFAPLLSFPELGADYCSDELFPLFKNRVLSKKRADFPEFINWLGLEPEEADPLSILAVSGGERVTDNLDVFPKIEPDSEGNFSARFHVHGLRHLPESSLARAKKLEAGDTLKVMVELNNPATRLAIPLLTEDYIMIGWAPRYLVEDLIACIPGSPEISVTVAKVNREGAPLSQSLLVEYAGTAEKSTRFMATPDFAPLIGD